MKKLLLLIMVGLLFSNTSFAMPQMYVGLGIDIVSNKFAAADISTYEKNVVLGLGGGVFLNNYSRIHINFYSTQDDDDIVDGDILEAAYNYSFNNHGTHKGFYVGAGIVMTTFKMDSFIMKGVIPIKKQNISGTDLLLKAGYEYQFNSNIFLDIAIISLPLYSSKDIKIIIDNTTEVLYLLECKSSAVVVNINYLF